MFVFSVYNTAGEVVNKVNIKDSLHYVDGRMYRGKKYYYKGVGVPYKNHSLLGDGEIDTSIYDIVSKSSVFYLGTTVSKKCFQGLTGVFQERYQPFYPDYIGSCSIKEGKIAINSIAFELSSVEVFDCIEFDNENEQSYYILDFKCNRKHYGTSNGNPKKLRYLLDFMLKYDWNFLWDKKAINDISDLGLVSDVADIFESKELTHKLGTVYSVLYSMGKLYPVKYQEFLKYNKFNHYDDMSYVINSVRILQQNKVDISPLMLYNSMYENYKHIVTNYLLTGKNCAYCACDLFKNQGDAVRDKYLELVKFQ